MITVLNLLAFCTLIYFSELKWRRTNFLEEIRRYFEIRNKIKVNLELVNAEELFFIPLFHLRLVGIDFISNKFYGPNPYLIMAFFQTALTYTWILEIKEIVKYIKDIDMIVELLATFFLKLLMDFRVFTILRYRKKFIHIIKQFSILYEYSKKDKGESWNTMKYFVKRSNYCVLVLLHGFVSLICTFTYIYNIFILNNVHRLLPRLRSLQKVFILNKKLFLFYLSQQLAWIHLVVIFLIYHGIYF